MTEPEDTHTTANWEELQARLDAMPTLSLVRMFLELLSDDIPEPSRKLDNKTLVMALLAQRAESLYANFHWSLGSPAEIGPVLAVRPLVELVILIKWIWLDPALHGFLYLADSDASDLSHWEAIKAHAKDRGSAFPEDPRDPSDLKAATRDAAFAKLKELGRNYGKGRIMPNVRRMADEVISEVPGHKIVMNDSYVYAYKTFSPWEHTEANSFKATANESSPGEWEWMGDKSPWHPEVMEVIASSMYAYVLETAFATIGDRRDAEVARKLRDHLMANFVRSEGVQPVTEEPATGDENETPFGGAPGDAAS